MLPHTKILKVYLSALVVALIILWFETGERTAWPKELNADANEALIQIQITNLIETVSHLQSMGNRQKWEKQQQAAQWALGQMKAFGLEAGENRYEFGGKSWSNIIARKSGSRNSDQAILLMAHLDSTSRDNPEIAPGADDNGSGVAVLMEAARVLSVIELDKTVIFCLFTNEERGSAGSKAYVQAVKKEGINLQAAINLDILGYNRPKSLLSLSAITAHGRLKYKIKAALRLVKNGFRSWNDGKDVIKVAGKEPNRKLASVVAQSMQKYGGIRVREIIGDDCG